MLKENDYFRDFLGVTKWHEQGYTGKNGLTFTGENLHDKTDKNYTHAQNTAYVFHEIAPDRKLVSCMADKRYATDASKVYSQAKETGADTMFISYTSSAKGFDILADLERFTPVCSIGNDGNKKANKIARNDNVISVGAYYLRNGTSPVSAVFSSVSKHVDFTAPTMMKTQITHKFSGTSCSAPVLCGMMALVNDFFIQKTGKPLKQTSMVKFLKDNAYDIGRKGFDEKTGHGMVILPDPSTINIDKYTGGEKKMKRHKVCLDPGHGTNTVNGSPDGTYKEKEFTWDMYTRIRPLLEKQGIEVVGTRVENEKPTLTKRCVISNNANAGLFVSLHSNAAGNGGWNKASGLKIITSSGPIDARRNIAARALIESFNKAGVSLFGAGIFHELDLTVLVKTTSPACLIEYGFHTNRKDVSLLKDYAYRNKLAIATAKGICDFLGVRYKEEETYKTPWYSAAQKWVQKQGISSGKRPNDPVTRAEVWTMLERMNGGK